MIVHIKVQIYPQTSIEPKLCSLLKEQSQCTWISFSSPTDLTSGSPFLKI